MSSFDIFRSFGISDHVAHIKSVWATQLPRFYYDGVYYLYKSVSYDLYNETAIWDKNKCIFSKCMMMDARLSIVSTCNNV